MTSRDSFGVESAFKLLGGLVALGGLLWGMWTYLDSRDRELETRRLEATKPFLERQLRLYTEATQVASALATSQGEADDVEAKERFWELYWGELALVEDQAVERAMVAFGRGLREGVSQDELQQLSLALAHSCRRSLAESWGVRHWERLDGRQ